MNTIQKKASGICVFCISSIISIIALFSAAVLIYTNYMQ